MLNLSRPLLRRAKRGEITELSVVIAAAQPVYRLAGFRRCPAHDVLASTMMGFSTDAGDVALLTYKFDL